MGSVIAYDTAAGKRYEVRFRTPERKTSRKRGFATKRDAERYLRNLEVAKDRGEYVSASAGRVTVGELAEAWRKAHAVRLKPATKAANDSALDTHVIPRWKDVYAVDVQHTAVREWVADLSARRGAATVRRAHNMLALILEDAVRDRRIVRNPAKDVPLPRRVPKPKIYLSHSQVARLAHVAGKLGPVVLVLAYTGLRWGEMAALKAGRVDLKRRRLSISENVVDVGGKLVWGTPKTHEAREVPFPAFLGPILADAIDGKRPDAAVFTGLKGGVLRHNTTRRRVFDPAVRVAGTAVETLQAAVGMPRPTRTGVFDIATRDAVATWQRHHDLPVTGMGDSATWRAIAQEDEARAVAALAGFDIGLGDRDFARLTPHDLRHTAASLAVSAGANVKALQRMLGHASAAMTLDRYADLFDDDLDTVANALDAARSTEVASKTRPSGPLAA